MEDHNNTPESLIHIPLGVTSVTVVFTSYYELSIVFIDVWILTDFGEVCYVSFTSWSVSCYDRESTKDPFTVDRYNNL